MSGARAVLVTMALFVAYGVARADGVTMFTPRNCPFTLPIPPGMALDPASVDDADYHDGTRAVFGTWKGKDLELEMICYASPTYSLPEAFLPAICSTSNPNLVAGSICGPSSRFDGAEVAWPEQRPDGSPKSSWTYVAHKTRAGRLTVRLIDRSAAALMPASRAKLAAIATTFAAAVK